VTLECPSECPYLQQARRHEKPQDVPEAPPEEMFPEVQLQPDFLHQHEPLIGGILHTLSKLAQADRHLHDRELISALASMVRTQQTLTASGLVYEEKLPNPAQQAVIGTLRELLHEFRELEVKHLGYSRLKDADILQALVFVLRLALMQTSGRPLSCAFIAFVQMRFPNPTAPLGSAGEPGSRIIIP
jgi:hypothetical protein